MSKYNKKVKQYYDKKQKTKVKEQEKDKDKDKVEKEVKEPSRKKKAFN